MRAAIIFIVLTGIVFLGCSQKQEHAEEEIKSHPQLTLVYYKIPNCPTCERVHKELKSIVQAQDSIIKLIIVDATTKSSKIDLTMYRLGNSGLLCLDANDQLLARLPGDSITTERVLAIIDSALRNGGKRTL